MSFAAVFAYFVAVAERSSLGVAAIQASDRFGTSATELSFLTVMQLVVYALMQIPVGVLLDRYGSKRLLVVGGVLMAAGQFLVAGAVELPQAILGRAVLGMGDAFTFISMIRIVNHWYSGAQATKRTQLYANLGQLGQVFSALPFAYFLAHVGWSKAYFALALFALAGVLLTVFLVKDSPTHDDSQTTRTPWRLLGQQLVANLKHPAVQMAFWTHFLLQSSGSVFVLLWGYSFLVRGEGVDAGVASLMLSSFVLIGFLVGPWMSSFCATHPDRRQSLVLVQVSAILLSWLMVLSWSGTAPLWLLVVLVLVIGSGGPGSMIAFDFTRSFIDKAKLGTANGFVNVGGFVATFVMMFCIGGALDLSKKAGWSESLFDLQGFRIGLATQLIVLIFGLVMFLNAAKRTRLSHSSAN